MASADAFFLRSEGMWVNNPELTAVDFLDLNGIDFLFEKLKDFKVRLTIQGQVDGTNLNTIINPVNFEAQIPKSRLPKWARPRNLSNHDVGIGGSAGPAATQPYPGCMFYGVASNLNTLMLRISFTSYVPWSQEFTLSMNAVTEYTTR